MAKKKAKAKPALRKAKTAGKARKPIAAKTSGAAKKARTRTAKAARPKPDGESLGRPLITAEEKLYLLFKEDYHARQIFEFLRVNTVGELEQFSPQQIIQILSAPVRRTVEGIRRRLAENKRHLRDDADFAREFLSARDSG